MASAKTGTSGHGGAAPFKRVFANRTRSFAERALVGAPLLWAITAAAIAVMTVAGGFGTGAFPPGRRLAFWALLIGWNTIKWQGWLALAARRPEQRLRAALIGLVPLTLLLPVELGIVLRVVGEGPAPSPLRTWIEALAIGGAILIVLLVALRRRRVAEASRAAAPRDGPLARARIAPAALAAAQAEDHYCRLLLKDGGVRLIHARFTDLLDETGGVDGERTHRGAWAAAAAVAGAEREGRRWMLILRDATRLPISARYLPRIRARGWLTEPICADAADSPHALRPIRSIGARQA